MELVAAFLLGAFLTGLAVGVINRVKVGEVTTQEQTKRLLDTVKADVANQFPNAGARLAQLDGHLATVQMVIEHIFEEDARK